MNRKKILKALTGAGFTGKTLDEALAFVKAENIELKNGSTVLDEAAFKAAWEVKAALVIEDEAEAVTEKKAVKVDETEEDGEADAQQKSAEAALRASRKAAADAVNSVTHKAFGIGDTKRVQARKDYAAKIKATAHMPLGQKEKAVYDDVDQAEFAGAYLRLAFNNLKGFLTYPQRENDLAIVGKASSETNNAQAGVLVAPQFYANVVWLTEQYGVARKLANVQRFSGTDEWRRPRKTALLSTYYPGEGGTITASDNTYDLITLVPKKLAALMLVSNELMDDSAVSIADQFTQSVAEAFAYAEDQAYFNGDGSATYGNQTGLANGLPSGAYLAAGATWAANVIGNATLAPGSVENIHPYMQSSWVMSRQAFYQTFGRLMNAGGGNRNIDLAVYTLANPGVNGANASINGDPVYFTQVLPVTTPSTGVPWAYYGNFAAASMLGVHTDLRITADPSPYFTTDQLAFRAIERFCVNIHGDGRGSTVGPIAALKTT